VLPVKRTRDCDIHPDRLVHTDPDDFLALVRFLAERYFLRPNYFRLGGRVLFSIFDSTFFVRQMGAETAREVIREVRRTLADQGFPDLHLMALNPAPSLIQDLRGIGFDSASHYVLLPEWKGEYLQDYGSLASLRTGEWPGLLQEADIPYFPSVSPGWDATPRGVMHGSRWVKRYPWWPVVVGGSPELFQDFLTEAIRFSRKSSEDALTFIASWNEWSEGHYLEPDERYGTGWLEAVREARRLA
jgi:hypothetical protein